MIKSHTIVKCVNNEYFPGSDSNLECDLTVGERYFVVSITDEKYNPHVRIINDANRMAFYRAWRFSPPR